MKAILGFGKGMVKKASKKASGIKEKARNKMKKRKPDNNNNNL